MKKVIFTLLIFGLWGCGSSSKKSSAIAEKDQRSSDIQNSDFDKVKEISYRAQTDQFVGIGSEQDSLAKESLSRAKEGILSRLEDDEQPLNQGISLCHQKKFAEGFAKLDEIYREYKKHPTFWNQIGSCYLLSGDKRKALLYYNKARGLNSRYAPAINNLGVIYLEEGKEQKALTAFKKALKINPNSGTPIFNMSQLYLKYGFFKEAEKLLNQLIKKSKEDVDVLAGIASVKLSKGDNAGAVAIYNKLPDDIQQDPYHGLNYAMALKLSGKAKDAKEALNETKKITTEHWKKRFQIVSRQIN